MADVIDELQINISADVGKARDSINKLITAFDKLETRVGSMSGLSGLSAAFTGISTSVGGLTTSTGDASTAMVNLGKTMTSTASSGTRSFGRLVSSANKLSKAVAGISFGKFSSLASSLPVIGRGSAIASRGIGNLSGSFTKSLISARAFISVIKGAWNAVSSGIDLASDLVEVQNVVDKAFGNEAGKIEDLVQNSIQTLGMSELTAKQISSRYQSMGAAMGISGAAIQKASGQIGKLRDGYNSAAESMADVSINLTKLSADMASFYNVGIEDVAEDLQAIFTGQTRPLRAYGLDLTQATLQEWALKQGMDADVKSMSQAEKTLLRYQYVMSQTKLVQGDFIDTADRLCVA